MSRQNLTPTDTGTNNLPSPKKMFLPDAVVATKLKRITTMDLLISGLVTVITLIFMPCRQSHAQSQPESEPEPQLLRSFSGHDDWINSMAFSWDGTLLLSGSEDNTMKLWETVTGRLLHTFSGHDEGVTSVAFSPDGTRLLSGSADGTIRLWESGTKRLLHTFSGHDGWVTSVAFSPDGTKMLSGSEDNTMKLWETGTGRLLHTFSGHDERVTNVTFLPDGTQMLSGSEDNTMKLWDAKTGRLLRTFSGHEDAVTSVAFSPDGNRLLSGSKDNTIKLWELSNGRLLRTFHGHHLNVTRVAFSPDGKRLISSSADITLKLWDADTGRLLRTFSLHKGILLSVAFSPDGTRLLSGGYSTMKLWVLPIRELVEARVEQRIKDWQQKDKYETSEAYHKRVTEQKRGELIRQYTTELVDSLGRAQFDSYITKTDYDADNKVFEVIFADGSSIYVNVPVGEAPAFDQNLSRLRFSNMDFTLTPDNELVLRKAQIHNPANDQTYAYDSGREVAFNTAELAANFDPIDVQVQTEDGEPNIQKGTTTFEVSKVDVDKNIPKTAMFNPDAIAVVIGNRRYQGNTPDVDFAANDARIVKKYLVKTLGYKEGNIIYVENATLSRMRALFGDEHNEGRLADYIKPGKSDVFVFYSGHGAPDPDTKTGYLVPVDGDPSALAVTGYSMEMFYKNLAKLSARSTQVVIDACFSGSSSNGQMLIQQASPIGIVVNNPAAYIENGLVITASQGDQISSWYEEKGHGLLTYFWLKGLQGAADQNGDGSVTASEIERYLTDPTEGIPYLARRLFGREQTPQVFGSDDQKVIVQHN